MSAERANQTERYTVHSLVAEDRLNRWKVETPVLERGRRMKKPILTKVSVVFSVKKDHNTLHERKEKDKYIYAIKKKRRVGGNR